MKHLLDTMLQDCSGPDEFVFTIRCGECGSTWSSRPARFSKAGIAPPSEGKRVVYDALYQKEKAEARQDALRQAVERFNICPICGRAVCNHCFMICEDLDMCVTCARRLDEEGTPVVPPRTDG